jgi:2,3-bisphosphoglycerate-dependent phosphoglycerate mutase
VDETCFLLIRHAESTWNAGGRWQGQGNPPLSARGRAQAAQLAERLAGEGIELLIASDLARCEETAAILGARWGLVPRQDPRLREIDIGAWTGLTRDQIEEREADLLARFEAEQPDARPGGGETRLEIRARVRSAAAELAAAHRGRCVALVTHLGVIRALAPGVELANADWLRLPAHALPPPRPRAEDP